MPCENTGKNVSTECAHHYVVVINTTTLTHCSLAFVCMSTVYDLIKDKTLEAFTMYCIIGYLKYEIESVLYLANLRR